MNFVFGPVPSRHLGQSLEIDPIPQKTCNWNCVYCQLGRSTPITNKRRESISCDAILAEVTEALQSHPAGEIYWVTFIGSGEPTLHSNLGEMIYQVLEGLSKSGRARLIVRYGVRFWMAPGTTYAN